MQIFELHHGSVNLTGLHDKAYDFAAANVTFAHATLLTYCHMPSGVIFISFENVLLAGSGYAG